MWSLRANTIINIQKTGKYIDHFLISNIKGKQYYYKPQIILQTVDKIQYIIIFLSLTIYFLLGCLYLNRFLNK
jgi:hypothetical protein